MHPGPEESFDVNVDQLTFDKLSNWTEQFGDIVAIRPNKRRNYSLLLNNPEHVHQVLVANHRNYSKGVGLSELPCCWATALS